MTSAWPGMPRRGTPSGCSGKPFRRHGPCRYPPGNSARRPHVSGPRCAKWPYKQLARAAWGQRPRKRSPADDTDLWLDAAGAVATMRRHIGVDSPLLEPVTLLRPADWVGAVIGLVRSGVNTIATAGDLVRYARQCPETIGTKELGDEAVAYDPFAGGVA